MEKIFIESLDFLKGLLLSEYIGYVCIACVFCVVLFFLVELIVLTIKKTKTDLGWYKEFCFMLFIVSTFLAIIESVNQKKFFINFNSVFTFSFVFFIILSTCSILLKLLNLKGERNKSVKIIQKPINQEIELENYGQNIKNAIDYVENLKESGYIENEYIDISAIKDLIKTLKKYELSETDYKNTEELEVYLLNFINRQPIKEERLILSEKITKLIKNLSYYQSKAI